MRFRRLLRALLGLAGLIGLAAAWVALRAVPRLAEADRGGERLTGVFHVHTDSSHDGRRSAAETLAGAGALGLDFVVFTEHNRHLEHARRPGDPVAVPGTELSTNFGHLIYLGLSHVPPEGPGRSTVGVPDSLAARGALTIPAHPTSPRRPWVGRIAGIGGLEIASTSSAARAKADPFVDIVPALLAFAVNRRLGLAQLYHRDARALGIWDRLDRAPVVGFCGTDSHGWLDPDWELRTWNLLLDPWPDAPDPLTAAAIVERLRAGRFACLAAIFADGVPGFGFRAITDAGVVPQGGSAGAARTSALEVDGPASEDEVTLVLLRDGAEVARTVESRLRHPDPAPGAWRVEVHMSVPRAVVGSRALPVLYSNRILLLPDTEPGAAAAQPEQADSRASVVRSSRRRPGVR